MSLDFAMISRMIVDSLSPSSTEKNEGFLAEKSADVYIGTTEKLILTVLTWTISILISVVAFWLSWKCNSSLGYPMALRALFGAGAFFFGLSYVLLYFIMRWDVCSGTMKFKK